LETQKSTEFSLERFLDLVTFTTKTSTRNLRQDKEEVKASLGRRERSNHCQGFFEDKSDISALISKTTMSKDGKAFKKAVYHGRLLS